MFGFSLGEIVVVMLIAVVAIGPRQLPSVLRKAGQWASKIRYFALNLRAQSGIDALLQQEGIDRDVRRIQSVFGKHNWLDALTTGEIRRPSDIPPKPHSATLTPHDSNIITLQKEYPEEGVDVYGAEPEPINPYQQRTDFAGNPEDIKTPDTVHESSGMGKKEPENSVTETPSYHKARNTGSEQDRASTP